VANKKQMKKKIKRNEKKVDDDLDEIEREVAKLTATAEFLRKKETEAEFEEDWDEDKRRARIRMFRWIETKFEDYSLNGDEYDEHISISAGECDLFQLGAMKAFKAKNRWKSEKGVNAKKMIDVLDKAFKEYAEENKNCVFTFSEMSAYIDGYRSGLEDW